MSDNLPRRHGMSWGSAELKALQDEWDAGMSITNIAQNHERTDVSICCQLDKMGVNRLAGNSKITGLDQLVNNVELEVYKQLTNQVTNQSIQGVNKMAQAIVLETRTYLNGRNISEYSNTQIYQMIQETETYLASLDKIQHKPKSLQVEIEKGNAAIVTLINYLDSQV